MEVEEGKLTRTQWCPFQCDIQFDLGGVVEKEIRNDLTIFLNYNNYILIIGTDMTTWILS